MNSPNYGEAYNRTLSRSTPFRFSTNLREPSRWLRRMDSLRPGRKSGNSPFRMHSAHFPPTSTQTTSTPPSARPATPAKSYILRRRTTTYIIRTNRVNYFHLRNGIPCCAGAGSRGTEPWRHPTVPPPRGPSARHGRPSRPYGLPSLTQMRDYPAISLRAF